MIIEEICVQPDDKGIIEALEHLPRGLSDLLDRKLRRVTVGDSARQAIKILQFCGVAKRPLTVDELREVLSVEPGQKLLDRARLPNDMERIIVDCGGLAFVDEEENTVHYVHHSVKKHLFKSDGPHSAEFIEADVDKHLGYLCMTYVDFNDFEREVAKVRQWSAAPLEPLKIGMSAISYRSGRSNRLAQKLLRQSFAAQSVPMEDFERKAQELLGSADASYFDSEFNREGFWFLAYAKKYWIFHLKNMERATDEQMWKLFCRCVNGRNITVDRPWTTCQQKRNLEWQGLNNIPKEIQWCLANKHNALFLYTAVLNNCALTEDVKRTILTYAVAHDERRFVEIITNYTPSDPETLSNALEASAATGRIETVSMLLAAGANVNAPAAGRDGQTALQAAAEGGHLDVVERLLAAKADVNAPATEYNGGQTALQAAAGGGHLSVVERLLAAKADVNAPAAEYNGGQTALQAAAGGGHLNVVESLLTAKADVNASAAGQNGRTALQTAAEGGHLDVIERLLAAKADVNAPAAGQNGRTALQAAAGGGHLNVVESLLTAKADVNAPATRQNGRTALQAAAGGGHLDVVERLLAAKADVNASGTYGRTALQVAAGRGYLDVVKRLRGPKTDSNAPG
jgi:ankyrin repeat protein